MGKKVTIALILFMMNSLLFSDGSEPLGDGTWMFPYQVQSLDNLLWISTNSDSWDNYYTQICDIDATETAIWNDGAGFLPIANNIPFTGSYDGGGYSIDALTINRPESGHIGLFATIAGHVEDLHLNNVAVTGEQYCGGISGVNSDGLINSCSISGSVTGEDYVGSIVGYVSSQATVSNCNSSCDVNGLDRVGGIVGANLNGSSTNNCQFTGIVIGNEMVGGIVGESRQSNIYNCDIDSEITGNIDVGGVAGYGISSVFTNCSFMGSISGSNSGGLIGDYYQNNYYINSYYDYENVEINGEQQITIGAISEEMFEEWQANDRELEITEYLTFEDEHYLISSLTEFMNLLGFVYRPYYDFELTTDIDLQNNPGFHFPFFSSSFDGNGHTVSNLYINEPDKSNMGLFDFAYSSGLITDLGLLDVEILGNGYVGGMLGYGHGELTITNCFSTGNVESLDDVVGGLIGTAGGEIVSRCYSTAQVNGAGCSYVGGLIGSSSCDLIECYTTGDIFGSTNVGGVSGWAGADVLRCYSFSDIIAENYSGGLVGSLSQSYLTNSYFSGRIRGDSYIGALVGEARGYSGYEGYFVCNVLNSIWNTDMNTPDEGIGIIIEPCNAEVFGKTTEEMQQIVTYTDIGWDFVGETVNGTDDYWEIDEEINSGYPFFTEIDVINDDSEIIEPGSMLKAFPNPFNPEISIEFNLNKSAEVKLVIYNVKGQKIKTLKDEFLGEGTHSLVWCPENLVSGVYYLIMQRNTGREVKKIVMLK